MAAKKVMPESHGQQAAQKQRPKGSHGKMAVKKRESHCLKAAKKMMLESHGQIAAHMPRLEGRHKSKDSDTRPQVSQIATA